MNTTIYYNRIKESINNHSINADTLPNIFVYNNFIKEYEFIVDNEIIKLIKKKSLKYWCVFNLKYKYIHYSIPLNKFFLSVFKNEIIKVCPVMEDLYFNKNL